MTQRLSFQHKPFQTSQLSRMQRQPRAVRQTSKMENGKEHRSKTHSLLAQIITSQTTDFRRTTTRESRTRAPAENPARTHIRTSCIPGYKEDEDETSKRERRQKREQETRHRGYLLRSKGSQWPGASRRVSPSGWLWNVCPRSPPRHRVAAAPSLAVVAASAAAGFVAEGRVRAQPRPPGPRDWRRRGRASAPEPSTIDCTRRHPPRRILLGG